MNERLNPVDERFIRILNRLGKEPSRKYEAKYWFWGVTLQKTVDQEGENGAW